MYVIVKPPIVIELKAGLTRTCLDAFNDSAWPDETPVLSINVKGWLAFNSSPVTVTFPADSAVPDVF